VVRAVGGALNFNSNGLNVNDIDDDNSNSIQPANAELSSFAFLSADDAHMKLGPVVGPRILRACEGLRTGQAIYWEDK